MPHRMPILLRMMQCMQRKQDHAKAAAGRSRMNWKGLETGNVKNYNCLRHAGILLAQEVKVTENDDDDYDDFSLTEKMQKPAVMF